MQKSYWALAILLVVFFPSCIRHVVIGRGKEISKTLNFSNFNKLDISAALHANITVKDGEAFSVSISGYENIVNEIKTELKDSTLHVFTNDDLDLGLKNNTELVITMPALSNMSLSGAPDIDVHGYINVSDFTVDLSGAGNINIDSFSVRNFTADLSGAAKLKISGAAATNSNIDISGAGVINAFGLHTDSAVVDISGAGKCDIYAVKSLNANISGIGKISYKGHPNLVSDISGAGSLADAN
jgi:Putative auto-transporter adhesin, head GIN domain